MPWKIGKQGSYGCGGFPVIVQATGKVVGCHPTKDKAQAQLAALNINAKEANRMAGKREYRQVAAEYRVSASKRGEIVADVLTYDVVDDYGTSFAPKVFTASMEKRMPRICWGHDWRDPLGKWNDYTETAKKLQLRGQLDLGMIGDSSTPAVPSAHRAMAQLESGTIDQFSVGFVRTADEKNTKTNSVRITQGILDETSPVLVGAVPGTKLISVRSRLSAPRLIRSGVPAGTSLWVPADVMQDILVRYESGSLDLGDALSELKGAALPYDELPTASDEEPDEEEEETPDEEEEPEEEEELEGWSDEDLDAQLNELGLELNA